MRNKDRFTDQFFKTANNAVLIDYEQNREPSILNNKNHAISIALYISNVNLKEHISKHHPSLKPRRRPIRSLERLRKKNKTVENFVYELFVLSIFLNKSSLKNIVMSGFENNKIKQFRVSANISFVKTYSKVIAPCFPLSRTK